MEPSPNIFNNIDIGKIIAKYITSKTTGDVILCNKIPNLYQIELKGERIPSKNKDTTIRNWLNDKKTIAKPISLCFKYEKIPKTKKINENVNPNLRFEGNWSFLFFKMIILH